MKTIVENITTNGVLNESFVAASGFGIEGMKFDDSYLLFFDSRAAHKMRFTEIDKMRDELLSQGIKHLLYYEYEYPLNLILRNAYIKAGCTFGDILEVSLITPKNKIRKGQLIQVIDL